MPRSGNLPGHRSYDIGWSQPRIPPMTRPYRMTGDNDGRDRTPWPIASGTWPNGNTAVVPSVTRTWNMERFSIRTMSCQRTMGARRASRIGDSCMPTAIVRFTAPVRLWGYVDGLSRIPGDRSARFCGEGMRAISSPYPTISLDVSAIRRGSGSPRRGSRKRMLVSVMSPHVGYSESRPGFGSKRWPCRFKGYVFHKTYGMGLLRSPQTAGCAETRSAHINGSLLVGKSPFPAVTRPHHGAGHRR